MSKETKHTPGPWTVRQPDSHVKPNNHFQVMAKSPHAEGLAQTICELNGPWVHANYKANAQLIASAPTLLEERDRLRDALEKLSPMIGSALGRLKFSLPQDAEILTTIQNALKARGKR